MKASPQTQCLPLLEEEFHMYLFLQDSLRVLGLMYTSVRVLWCMEAIVTVILAHHKSLGLYCGLLTLRSILRTNSRTLDHQHQMQLVYMGEKRPHVCPY